MDKQKVINFGNKLYNPNGANIQYTEVMEFISEYLQDKMPEKSGEMMKAFISFPDNLKFEALKTAVEYYVKKFGIFTLKRINPLIGGQQFITIKYYYLLFIILCVFFNIR